MKKFLRISICAAFALAFAVSSTGCGKAAVPEHEHTFSEEWSHTAETHWHFCTYPGCNEHGDEQSHEGSWELISTIKAPTCYSNGTGKYRCTVCGEEKTDVVPATENHVWEDTWRQEEDYHYKKCTQRGCKAQLNAPHTPGNLVDRVPVEVYKDGLKTSVCTDCGYELERVVVPATGVVHSFKFGFQYASGLDACNGEPFFWFDESDEMYHISVVRDDDAGANESYNLTFTDLKCADGRNAQMKMYSAGAGFTFETLSTSDNSNGTMLYGPYDNNGIPAEGWDMSTNELAMMGNSGGKNYVRFRWYGDRIMRIRFVYNDGTKITSSLEIVVNVIDTVKEYNTWRSEWIAAHPDVERLSFVPSAAN